MGNNKHDESKRLVDFAMNDVQLLWSRYGCMVVANSIFLGFIGQLATKKCNGSFLGMCACGMGLLIAFLWLFITSYSWEFSWYMLKQSDGIEKTEYKEWKKKMCKCKVWEKCLKCKDPIWLCSHLVIFLFCLAYLFLTSHFSTLLLWIFIFASVGFMIFWFKKFLIDEPKVLCDEPKDEQKQ